jgi:16S rRNA (uracil1498-N3)-methyltransferase
MHRFFIPPEECHNNPLRLSQAEAKHARSVLRLREGDRVVVLNGAGKELLCQAEEARNDSTTLEIIQENSIPPLPFQITLYQAVTKGKAMDFIVQKASELGAYRVVPVLSERSVPDWDEAKTAAKVERNGAASASSRSNNAAPHGCPGLNCQ